MACRWNIYHERTFAGPNISAVEDVTLSDIVRIPVH